MTNNTIDLASPRGLVRIPRRKGEAYKAGEVGLDDFPYEELGFSHIASELECSEPELEDEPEPPKPEPHSTIDHRSGWLSPEGQFYPCDWMEHLWLLSCLELTDVQAEKSGWIKISDRYAWSHYHLHGVGQPPTQRQIDLVFDWCVENGHELPHWMKPE